MTRRLRNALLVLVLAALAVVAGPATSASAHAGLISTDPPQNSVVDQAPAQVTMTFTEGVRPVAGKVRVIAPDGVRADSDAATTSGDDLIIPLKTGVQTQGTYVVAWRVISADSHPVAGTFTFSVGQASTPPSVEAQSSDSTYQGLLPPVRWVGYVGLLLLVGSTLILAVLWPRRLDRTGVTRLVWIGAGLVAVATVAELLVQVPYDTGTFTADSFREVASSQFGAAHLVRLGVLAAAAVLIRQVIRDRAGAADRVLLVVLGVIGIATWSLSGHPSATAVKAVTIVADMVHIASMSVWLGGLVVLIIFLLPRATAKELATIVPVWSRWATYAVGALLLTGVAQAIIAVGTPGALVTTTYGAVLLAKIALVGVILAAAFLSRRLVAPIEAGADRAGSSAARAAVPRLRRAVIVEAAVAVVVLGLTSVLVQLTPAHTAAGQVADSGIQTVTMTGPLFTLEADLSPGTVGANEVHLYAYAPDGSAADIKQWTGKASTTGLDPIDVVLLPLEPNHATGQVDLPQTGTWTLSFTLRTTDIDQSTVTATFAVAAR